MGGKYQLKNHDNLAPVLVEKKIDRKTKQLLFLPRQHVCSGFRR